MDINKINKFNDKFGCISIERSKEILNNYLNSSPEEQERLRNKFSWGIRIATSVVMAYETGKLNG